MLKKNLHLLLISFIFLIGINLKGQMGSDSSGVQIILPPVTLNDLQAQSDRLINKNWKVFTEARSLRDFSTAIMALHNYLAEDGSNQFVRDTLLGLYYESGKYESCILMGEKIVQAEPQNPWVRLMLAQSYESLEDWKQALLHFETLSQLRGDLLFPYKMLCMQYNLERFAECKTTANEILKNIKIHDANLWILNGAQAEEVKLQAAVYNVLGNIALLEKDNIDAKNFFLLALAIEPDFFLAKENLSAMENKKKKK